jgi:hypothetical protein
MGFSCGEASGQKFARTNKIARETTSRTNSESSLHWLREWWLKMVQFGPELQCAFATDLIAKITKQTGLHGLYAVIGNRLTS